MKTLILRLFVLIFILLKLTFVAVGQNNISIAEEGHEWTCASVADIGEVISHYYYQKDTIINDTMYSKISGYSDYLIREDNGKVYLSWIGGEYLGEEYTKEFLRYDFNLNLNDTFKVKYPGPDFLAGPEEMVVINIDSIVLDNMEKRKRITLDMLGPGYDEDMIWIEGIGSDYGLDYRTHFTTSVPHYLSCFSKLGTLTYKGPFYDYGGCIINYLATGLENQGESIGLIKIYPNPSHSIITIESKKTKINAIKIYNQIGQMVSHKTDVQSSNGICKFDISNLNNGTYIIEIIDDSSISLSKMIIKR